MSLCDIFPDDPSCTAEPETPAEPEDPNTGISDDEGEGDQGTGQEADDDGKGVTDDAVEEAEDMLERAEERGEITETEKRVFDAVLEVTKWDRLKQLSMFADMSPFGSNLAYFMVAGGAAFNAFQYGMRYRSKSTYYDDAKIGTDTNWWKTSDQLRNYGGLVLFGTLAVTQLLAMFGIAVPLNGTLWMLGGGLGGMILAGTIGVMRFLGYEAGFKEYKDGTANLSKGTTLMAKIRADVIYDEALGAANMLALAGAAEGWYFDLWNHATNAERLESVAGWEETIATRAADYAEKNPEGEKKEGKKEEKEEEAEEGEGEGEGEEGEEGEAEEGEGEEPQDD